MKGCIVGVGAIGGLIGAKLAASGHAHVSALSRGAALQAIRRHGWRLITANEAITAPARVTDNPEELGTQDLVILAIKAPALATAVASLRPMLGRNTMILPAMNGVPWWFCQSLSGSLGTPLQSVDPDGVEIGRAHV